MLEIKKGLHWPKSLQQYQLFGWNEFVLVSTAFPENPGTVVIPSPTARAGGSSSAGSWSSEMITACGLCCISFSQSQAGPDSVLVEPLSRERCYCCVQRLHFCTSPAGCSRYTWRHQHKSAQCVCTHRFHRTETMRDGTFCLSGFAAEAWPVRLFFR